MHSGIEPVSLVRAGLITDHRRTKKGNVFSYVFGLFTTKGPLSHDAQ